MASASTAVRPYCCTLRLLVLSILSTWLDAGMRSASHRSMYRCRLELSSRTRSGFAPGRLASRWHTLLCFLNSCSSRCSRPGCRPCALITLGRRPAGVSCAPDTDADGDRAAAVAAPGDDDGDRPSAPPSALAAGVGVSSTDMVPGLPLTRPREYRLPRCTGRSSLLLLLLLLLLR